MNNTVYRISNMPGLADDERRQLIELGGEDWESTEDSFAGLLAWLQDDIAFKAHATFVRVEPAYEKRNPGVLGSL